MALIDVVEKLGEERRGNSPVGLVGAFFCYGCVLSIAVNRFLSDERKGRTRSRFLV